MREIVVLSGKGGTGKTTVLASFAALADNSVLCDCDVDAPNLHLLLAPQAEEAHEFYGLQVAHIDTAACNECGLCVGACRFDAIHDFHVDPPACEGCGLCARVCPLDAISMRDTPAGHWYVSWTRFGPLVHARLRAAQENSGKLVMAVRKRARELAQETGATFILMQKVQDKPAQAATTLKFFDWAYKSGDKTADELDYVPMPDAVKAQIQKAWGDIKDTSGKAVAFR